MRNSGRENSAQQRERDETIWNGLWTLGACHSGRRSPRPLSPFETFLLFHKDRHLFFLSSDGRLATLNRERCSEEVRNLFHLPAFEAYDTSVDAGCNSGRAETITHGE